MRVEKLLALIPGEMLTGLAIETKVDYYAKKLQGELLFKLLLHCLLTGKETSLRSAASAYESVVFGALNAAYLKDSIRHNAISYRLSTINADYFKRIYEHCVQTYGQTIGHDDTDKLLRFDSTIVTLCSRLMNIGYNIKGDSSPLQQLKFSIGLGQIPQAVRLYTDKGYSSEDKALKEVILAHADALPLSPFHIIVFDRGIGSRITYDLFSEKGIRFVSRLNPGARYKLLEANRLKTSVQTQRLSVEQDLGVQLFGSHGVIKTKHPLRLIKATQTGGSGKALWFVTNITDDKVLSALQVTEVYKRRWDIEVFFKFLKQHLNFSHLLNRTENGVGVMMYVTMIAATLVMAYKKLNDLKGYKIVKQRLSQDLEAEILKTLISLCGGNPDRLNQILRHNSS